MEEKFTWIPFYMELSKALLAYKENRKPLVDFIYTELSKVGGRSLVNYLQMEDGSKIKDIDPFSVFAIFNRNLKPENRIGFVQKFKDKFNLKSELPKDFDGIPTVNSQRAFFFNWADKNAESIQEFWEIFEGVVLEKDISGQFDRMVNKTVSQYSLTMILYWIAPYRFINLDGRNRSYLNTLGLPDHFPSLNYAEYAKIIENVQRMMDEHKIPSSSFPELSYAAWSMAQTDRIWMYKRDDGVFERDFIGMGSSAKGMLDFSTFKSKKALGDAYREISGNTDVSVPDMYWKFIKDVKEGDIVVVFDSIKAGRTYHHLLHGWGRITSDVFYDNQDNNPIQRKVEWYLPRPAKPIKETRTNNTRYLHEVTGIEAANIMKLLDISSSDMNTKRNYWLVGYYIDDQSQIDDFFAKNEWRAWFGERDANQLKLAKNIQKGDILIMKSTLTKGRKHDIPCMRIKAVGVVESEMEVLDDKPDYDGLRYEINFISKDDRDFDGSPFGSYRRTIHKCDNQEIIDYVDSLFFGKMEEKNKYQKYISLLNANKNLILTGAPGTGKTFMAKAIAKEMGAECEFVQFHPSYDYTDFVEGLRPIQEIAGEVGFERRDGVFKEFCAKALKNLQDSKKSIQALQEESSVRELLENFIEESMESGTTFETSGTKNVFFILDNKEKSIIVKIPANEKTSEVALPKSDLTTLLENKVPIKGGKDIQTYFKRKYRTQPDSYIFVLYNILRKRSSPQTNIENVTLIPEKKYVFIIDEINRGEISKIFGELFFSIDPGYRGIAGRVKTQYQNLIEEGDAFKEGFYVPENVYIIGTMNDIDRSVESMDFAMRRRFAWAEVTAEESMQMLDGIANENEVKTRMQNLNHAILQVRGLGEAYQIGAAYFKKIEDYGGNFHKLWDFHLKGLLYEYLRGNMNAEEQLDELKKAYDNNAPVDGAANSNQG